MFSRMLTLNTAALFVSPITDRSLISCMKSEDEVIYPHGNWKGLSVGWLTTTWLSYILPEANHRMSEVEPWAEQEIETFEYIASPSLSLS